MKSASAPSTAAQRESGAKWWRRPSNGKSRYTASASDERRRPVDATVAGPAFEERTVEVRETEEVPVVEKTTHVAEEVAVRKEQTERTETVRDTVRREEVEVTDKDGRPASIG